MPENLEPARDENRGLEIFLWRYRQRHRSAQRRPRDFRSAAHSSRHPHDHRLRPGRRIFRRREDGGNFLRRADLALRSINTARSTRPVWFNVGLYHQYGIGKNAGAGNYFYNRETGTGRARPTQYEYPQGSACFIQSVEDTMEDIMELAMSEAMLFKYGSGTGTDLSSLRSTREKLSGGGKPSGPLSFLKVYDQVANVVKSGGKTRRAAKMNTLKDWHPDIEEFIEAKQKEEKQSLGADRAGLRRQLQWRRLRLGHVSERKSERARERRLHERRDRRPRMVDPPGARRLSRANARTRALCSARSPKARMSAAIPGCNSIPPSTSGTPAKAPAGRTPPIRARNISSSITPPAISPR